MKTVIVFSGHDQLVPIINDPCYPSTMLAPSSVSLRLRPGAFQRRVAPNRMIPQLHSNARAKQCTYRNSHDTRELRLELMEREELSARSRLARALHGRIDARVYSDRRLQKPNPNPSDGEGQIPREAPNPPSARGRSPSSPPVCNVLRPNIDTNIINSTIHQTKVITQVVVEGSDSRRVPSPTVVTKFIDKRIVESRNLFLRTAGKVKPYLVVTEKTATPRNGRPPELPELPPQQLCRGITAAAKKGSSPPRSPQHDAAGTPRGGESPLPAPLIVGAGDLHGLLKTRHTQMSPARGPRSLVVVSSPRGAKHAKQSAIPAAAVVAASSSGTAATQTQQVSISQKVAPTDLLLQQSEGPNVQQSISPI
jgi:hypothetical protein